MKKKTGVFIAFILLVGVALGLLVYMASKLFTAPVGNKNEQKDSGEKHSYDSDYEGDYGEDKDWDLGEYSDGQPVALLSENLSPASDCSKESDPDSDNTVSDGENSFEEESETPPADASVSVATSKSDTEENASAPEESEAEEENTEQTVEEYKIYLDLNGGEWYKNTVITVKYGEEYSIPAPIKSGYDFVCWELEDGEEFEFEGVFLFDSDITVKAIYRQK